MSRQNKLIRVYTDTSDFIENVANALARERGKNVTIAEATEHICRLAYGDAYGEFLQNQLRLLETRGNDVDPETMTSAEALPVAP